jgi:hypothetical protein
MSEVKVIPKIACTFNLLRHWVDAIRTVQETGCAVVVTNGQYADIATSRQRGNTALYDWTQDLTEVNPQDLRVVFTQGRGDGLIDVPDDRILIFGKREAGVRFSSSRFYKAIEGFGGGAARAVAHSTLFKENAKAGLPKATRFCQVSCSLPEGTRLVGAYPQGGGDGKITLVTP